MANAKSSHKDSPIASTVGGLFSLPGLVLSMYRAIAPSFYSLDPSGNMFLYNDSLWLAESLRRFTGTQFKQTGHIDRGAADVEISALETFAKRTYSKEMESQRTIIGDLLDGAQGFANCTQPPFAQECDIAISSVVDRLREIHRQWRPVLSHSALLQSLGSLLSTVAKKIIVDIEDMSDISEPESHRLAAFCTSIASLEDLFTPLESAESQPGGEQPIPLTAVYTPNWLKFQYLANILESSLVDIKYLWTEGELRLEFNAEELVDLIEALFADSEHRRRAITEIRKS
jgi:centromere/kinetochore protein ZW10